MSVVVRQAARLSGEIRLPGDKSLSHRLLVFGALSPGTIEIRNVAPGEDAKATARCLRSLGAKIETSGEVVRIRGPGELHPPQEVLDCGNSGTTMRLLAGVLAGAGLPGTLDGDASLRRRPMGRVLEPLRRMGARCEGTRGPDGEERAPLTFFAGSRLEGGHFRLPMASAQVKSAILLAGLLAGVPVRVEEPGLSRDHTERMLGAFAPEGRMPLRLPEAVIVPGDPSSAAFLAAAAALVPGSELRLRGIGANPTRIGWIQALRRMGADLELVDEGLSVGEPVATLLVRHSPRLRAIRIEGEEIPSLIDEIPILAVVATQAEGTTEIRGASELRVKESDRIAAMAEGLTRMGAEVEPLPDGLRIHGPTPLRGARVDAASDHRVAMSLAVAGLRAAGETTIEGGEWASVSFPDFFRALDTLQASP